VTAGATERRTAPAGRRAARLPDGNPEPSVGLIDRIAERALWLAVRMIHEANVVRLNEDGLKVGGHQASSASVASILSTLYLEWLGPDDLVAVKPHASPIYHALTYLMGGLDVSYLTTLRAFGGLQSYPSQTKDPDRVDFSTGSVGLGAMAPLFASLADRYLRHHAGTRTAWPDRRFVAVVGDAELDEGSVWEGAAEPAFAGLGNVTMIVDLNRQSLDRVIPGVRVRQLEGMFEAAGWQVVEAKYGGRLAARMAGPGGAALRQRIDEMANEEYQVLIRRTGAEARARCIEGAPAADHDDLARALTGLDDDDVPGVLADLGGHDPGELLRALAIADAVRSRPAVVFAYTVKGWRLPFAGDSMNHSAQLTTEQVERLAPTLGAEAADPWAPFPDDSPEGRLCAERGRLLNLRRVARPRRQLLVGDATVPRVDVRIAQRTSTQQAFGDTLATLARLPEIGPRVVTASPDVTVSTGLGSWVNRVGVFASEEATVHDETSRLLTWAPKPGGQHIELGISEMNLFLLLSQFGLTAELFGEPLIPVGTVYDPFVARGLDAFIYALYVGARFIIAGTPSGVSLAPEGGAHQSTITASIGIELPGLHAYEPAFAQEVVWLMEEGIRGVLAPADGFSTYLRLTTRNVDQSLAGLVQDRLGEDEWRRQTIAGGYRLLEAKDAADLPPGAPVVNIVAVGAVVSEAIEAARELQGEEVAANLIVVTSPDRLSAEVHDRRLAGVRERRGGRLGHLPALIPPADRRAPMVTVHDGASHALAFMGSIFGAPVVPLGVDTFGQSGRISDLYAYAGIDASHIVEAALLALELG
jgi:pyruvate dehydrogenase E1 component